MLCFRFSNKTETFFRIKISNNITGADVLNADFEKLSVGQTVTVPYRDTGSQWNSFKIIIGDPQGIAGQSNSTNKSIKLGLL